MTLFQAVEGGQEIQLLHFGRAHTGGDVVIFLPEEKVAFTGDMMLPGLSYMGDGHVDEWPDSLEGLKGLDLITGFRARQSWNQRSQSIIFRLSSEISG